MNFPANLAAVVVLPAPCSPTIIMIEVSEGDFKTISVFSEPISFTSSSFTIFITCCPGVSELSTSVPTARSCISFINCLTILKFTSASNKANLTSFRAAFTSASESLPLPLRFLKTFCSFSDKLSNAISTPIYLKSHLKYLLS